MSLNCQRLALKSLWFETLILIAINILQGLLMCHLWFNLQHVPAKSNMTAGVASLCQMETRVWIVGESWRRGRCVIPPMKTHVRSCDRWAGGWPYEHKLSWSLTPQGVLIFQTFYSSVNPLNGFYFAPLQHPSTQRRFSLSYQFPVDKIKSQPSLFSCQIVCSALKYVRFQMKSNGISYRRHWFL